MTDELEVGRIAFGPNKGQKVANDPADPWSMNYFDPPAPRVAPPAPRVQTPKLLPDVDRLFSLQADLVRAVNALDAVERKMKRGKSAMRASAKDKESTTHTSFDLSQDRDFLILQRNVENAYRVINRYLKEFAATGGGTF